MRYLPVSGELVRTSPALLSWMIVAVRCTQCNHWDKTEGALDYVELLDRHREHLGNVIVDLFLSNLGTEDLSEIRICLAPVELQMMALFFSVN